MYILKIFAIKLKELRKEKGITQRKLAEALKCGHITIKNYEKGKSSPSLKYLCEIAKYFSVSTDYLLGMSNIRQINRCKPCCCISKKLNEEGRQKVEQFIEFLIYKNEKENDSIDKNNFML